MTLVLGEFGGEAVAFNDFTGGDGATWAAGGVVLGGGVGFVSVNEGSFANTVDEPGGILAITNDTGDNDNSVLFAGAFQPSLGECVMECRLKVDNVSDIAFFVGFTETLAKATPVMPAEFATATMTYNGTGGMVGLQFDSDGTTDAWRACMGDGGAATSGSGNGTAATAGANVRSAAVADRWDIVRVELHPDTSADVYLNGVIVKSYAAGGLTATDQFHAVAMCENRAADAAVWEVDYFYARGPRDWNDD